MYLIDLARHVKFGSKCALVTVVHFTCILLELLLKLDVIYLFLLLFSLFLFISSVLFRLLVLPILTVGNLMLPIYVVLYRNYLIVIEAGDYTHYKT